MSEVGTPVRAGPWARWQRLGLTRQILLGLALGAGLGIFFGESARVFEPMAEVYIRLMQMTVLPYLILTLIVGLGRMDAAQARTLAWRGGLALLAFWVLALIVIGAMPLAFPGIENASFFSSSLLEERAPLALPEVYVPANPFHAMANSIVPAVVLFCAALGIALIGMPEKATLLDALEVMERAVVRVTRFVIALTPLGVLAIAASTVGTLELEQLKRLEVYFIAFTVAALLLAFVVLPLAVAAVTPYRWREVVWIARDALLTAFLANSAFIVLPILAERARELMARHHADSPGAKAAVEVVVPLAFTFPNAGKLLTLLFVPFAAWLAGTPLAAMDYGALFAAGVPAYFAKAQVAIPFLLDLVGVAQDQFQLYIPTTVLTGKLDSMVSAMSVLALALVTSAGVGGYLRLSGARLLGFGVAATIVLGAAVLGTRLLMGSVIDTGYHKADALKRMHAPRTDLPMILHRDAASLKPEPAPAGAPTLARVRARGTLRVGYDADNLPFSFFNAEGQLVGYDVDAAQSLAAALGVTAELIPVRWRDVPRALAEGSIDVMPGVWYRPYWFASLRLSQPYLTVNMGFVTLDERRGEFASIAALRRSQGLRIGVPLDPAQVASSIAHYFAGAPVEFVPIESAADYFEGRTPSLDALLMPAEHAAAATLVHPRYSAVVPKPDPVRMPIGFGTALHSGDLVEAINEWVVFAQADGSLQRAYEHWVLGRGADLREPRWSVWHNVLNRPRPVHAPSVRPADPARRPAH